MPRPPRDDLQPEIRLPDVAEDQQRATAAISTRSRAIVYDPSQPIGREPRSYEFDGILEERLRECREQKVGIDEGFLSMMLRSLQRAEVREARDTDGNPRIENGMRVCRLLRVGCRVHATQAALAERYGRSRQFANDQIAKLKDWGFIVNWGRGWYEFDATLRWKGDLASCAAYRQVQRARGQITVTDGTKTAQIGQDMDEDTAEHMPPASQRERGE